jgi:hypothetical protein
MNQDTLCALRLNPEQEITLPVPRGTLVVPLVIFAFFLIMGIAVRDESPVIAWGCATFAAAGLLAILLEFVSRPSLILAADTFIVRAQFREYVTRWVDVTSFRPVTFHRAEFVGYNYREGYWPRAKFQGLTAFLGGCAAMLPHTYGLRAGQLTEIMETRRIAAQTRSGSASAIAAANAALPGGDQPPRAQASAQSL